MFMTILERAESFKTKNQPEPTRPNRNALWQFISRKAYKIVTSNFDKIKYIKIQLMQ